MQVTWAKMKSDKRLYTFLQDMNTTNENYMKEFDTYFKVIEYYVGRILMHPGLIKAKIVYIEVQDTENPTPDKKEKSEEGAKE